MVKKGGSVVGSGGFGCVFRPALKCKGRARTAKKMVSKLMTIKDANAEFIEINKFKKILKSIPDYKRHFMLDNITKCSPDILTIGDLEQFDSKCHALTSENFSAENLNMRLSDVNIINLPDGGVDVGDYMDSIKYSDMVDANNKFIYLLVGGIIKMNKLKVLHADIKDSNILIDRDCATLIDWGLSSTYTSAKIPDRLRNRSLQYNLPFSSILFNDMFNELYANFLINGTPNNEDFTREFVKNYIIVWFGHRGEGHYKTVQKIFADLSKDYTHINAMDYMVNYLTLILLKFTINKKMNITAYFNKVYIHIVDVWGFITIYCSIFERLSHAYLALNKQELVLYAAIKHILLKYLYEPRVEPIDIQELKNALTNLNVLFADCNTTNSATFSQTTYRSKLNTELVITYKPSLQKTRKHVAGILRIRTPSLSLKRK